MRRWTSNPVLMARPFSWVAAFVLLLAAGCGRQAVVPAVSSPHVQSLAVVDGRPVTEADFRLWWSKRAGATEALAARQEALDQLIERSALASAARRAGLDRDPEVVAEMDRLLIARLRTTRLQERLSQIEVPESELAAEYERGRAARYHRPEQVRVAVLWLETRGQEPLAERYRPRLEAVRAELARVGGAMPATNGFGRWALANSEHRASRHRGGDIGWIPVLPSQDSWRTEVLRLAGTLRQPGETSEVSATPAGVFLVRLIDRESGGEQPYAAVREQIRRSLLTEHRRRVEDQFQREALEAAHIERPPGASARLAALSLPVPTNTAFATAKSGSPPTSAPSLPATP